MKQFFIAHAYCEMQLNEEALELYMELKAHGFSKSTYVMAQIALAQHGLKGTRLNVNKSCDYAFSSRYGQCCSQLHRFTKSGSLSIGQYGYLLKSSLYQSKTFVHCSSSMAIVCILQELRMELAHLAHNCCDIDKYRVETCCVVGNYYSLRGQHDKAVLYFQRALRLNPHYLSAWTLVGHEYMELKNTSAAIQAYRHAIGTLQNL
jgi:anaphase-promoting complex subunit 8